MNTTNERRDRERKYILNHPWATHHKNSINRCNKKYGKRSYLIKKIEYKMTIEEIEMLWIKCNADKLKYPCIHRLKDRENYTFDNCVFIEESEHRRIHRTDKTAYSMRSW